MNQMMNAITKNNIISSIVDNIIKQNNIIDLNTLSECEIKIYSELSQNHIHWVKDLNVYHIKINDIKYDIIIEWTDRRKKQQVIIQPLELNYENS